MSISFLMYIIYPAYSVDWTITRTSNRYTNKYLHHWQVGNQNFFFFSNRNIIKSKSAQVHKKYTREHLGKKGKKKLCMNKRYDWWMMTYKVLGLSPRSAVKGCHRPREFSALAWMARSLEAATIFIALVIFWMFLILFIRVLTAVNCRVHKYLLNQ